MQTAAQPVVPPGWGTPPPGWGPQSRTPPSKPTDLEALRRFKLASIVSIVGTAAGFLYPLVASLSGQYSIAIPTAGGSVTLNATAVYAAFGTAVVGMLLGFVGLLLMRMGFVALRKVDSRFESTPTFALVAMIGFLLLAGGVGLFIGWLVPFVSCVNGASTVPAGCVNVGTLLGAVALLGIGGLLLLIGGIGTLIGVWRLGDRYNDGLFKAGAILLIFLGVVGSILILIAASKAEGAVRNMPDLPAPGTYAPPPPLAPSR